MTAHGFALFETAIGRCGIAWGERGVASVQLPEAREADTRARMLRRFPGAQELPPSPEVQRAVEAIVALLRGERTDLADIPLDMNGVSPFYQRVYEVARTIAPGATLSYGEVATRLGSPGSARAVGQALGRNPFPIVVPCHRVLAAGGKMGGFSANGGITTKLKLLTIEGARHEGARSFDADEAIAHLRAKDARLGRLFDKVGPFRMRVDETPSIFLALAESIVYQQLTTKAAATIFARVRALFPHAAEGFAPEHVLRASDEKLRGAGLSRAKLLALRDLAQRAKDGELPTLDDVRGMTDETIIERLTEVRGIGRWTVEMLLIFRLGRPDVLPVDDYGIRKGFMLAFGKSEMPERKALEKYGTRWKPYRSVASWYLWRALEATWP
ncbi:methylated-DNA--[protein]-cysteine S-methyltransferase [Pendulispora brunnea]|uniref:DNA-3-methyladenine glycosylase II n=1 Tax=Pendulispora brunnea TaxID=2905690 RepID=A0ABZ2KCM5_9BACT